MVVIAVVALVMVLAGCASPPSGEETVPADASMLDEETRAALDAAAEQAFAASGMPGVAMSVFSGDDRWDYVAGVADVDTGEPFALDANVRIASISKTFTATAVLQLVDAGQLALDDVLEEFIPGMPNGDRITIRDLLAMTSGLYEYTLDPQIEADLLADPTMEFGLDQVIQSVLSHEPEFEPGEDVSYCDTNYWFLGEIIEQVSGRPLVDVINELAASAGLASTRVSGRRRLRAARPASDGVRPGGGCAGAATPPGARDRPRIRRRRRGDVVDDRRPARSGRRRSRPAR